MRFNLTELSRQGYNACIMQSLKSATVANGKRFSGKQNCANDILDTVPMVMRIIRKQMRQHRSGLNVPQFRTLCLCSTEPGSSLSDVADFIGLSLPAMSRLVDGLVDWNLIEREPSVDDRRHIRLSVTSSGKTAVREARQLAQDHLDGQLAGLSATEQGIISRAMQLLDVAFSSDGLPESTEDRQGDSRKKTTTKSVNGKPPVRKLASR